MLCRFLSPVQAARTEPNKSEQHASARTAIRSVSSLLPGLRLAFGLPAPPSGKLYLKVFMGTIAKGAFGGLLAVAQSEALLGLHRERYGREASALVGAVAVGLVG